MKMPKFKISSIIVLLFLFGIMLLSYASRTNNTPNLVADYDPWWFFRHAKEILDNNLIPPKWDILSFFPPGRPFPTNNGWLYTIIIFHKILSAFTNITFMKTAIISPGIMTALSVIPAFFLGKELSNKWGGLVTAIFAVMAPTFIGVSMSGYLDTDVVVIFWSFLSVLSIFLAMREKKWYYIAVAVITNLLFVNSWFFGWYVLLFFSLLIPLLAGFRLFKDFLKGRFKIEVRGILSGLKDPLLPLVIILVLANGVGIVTGLGNILQFALIASGFRLGQGALVNVSVAELQPVNVLTKGGFNAIAQRVGIIPMYFMLIGLPLLIAYKIYKKEKIGYEEIFLFMWTAITFYIILNGVRFALLFTIAVSASAGYVIGNVIRYLEGSNNLLLKSTVLGLVAFLVFYFTAETFAFALNVGGLDIGDNWAGMLEWLKNNADSKAVVATWWDPGHIIAGYSGLRVNADGAHCSSAECITYSHDDRIQDMGRIMSTSDEKEAVTLLQKYMQLTPEQCQKVKEKYGSIVPQAACEPASEMYFIASSDLIGKFTWMNYFGGYRAPISSLNDLQKNPGVCCASTPATELGQMSCGDFSDQGRGVWVWCPWIFSYSETGQSGNDNIYVYDYQGFKLAIVQKPDVLVPVFQNKYVINKMVFFSQDGTSQFLDLSSYSTSLEKIDGLIWVQPDFTSLLYFPPQIKDSIFVKTFLFNGQGLDNFKLVYSNPEIRLYKVDFKAS